MTYSAPNIQTPEVFNNLLSEYNILIAGSCGSGKSTMIEGMIYSIACNFTPDEAELYLIDPKMVQLDPWRVLPHVVRYEDTAEGAKAILEDIKDRMMRRYEEMKRMHIREWGGSHVYIIIDELADLMIANPKAVSDALIKILQLGRAARIHIVAATQQISREVLKGTVQVNFTCRVGLHCVTAIESRMVIGQKGCEALPIHGKGIINHNGFTENVVIPFTPEKNCDVIRRWWVAQRMRKFTGRGVNHVFNS